MNLGDKITLSIVSHGQSALVALLLSDLAQLSQSNIEVIVTINIPENMFVYQQSPIPIKVIRNEKPKGFGENHNAAFKQASSEWFVVVNPDIRIQSLDIQRLLRPFLSEKVAAVAPVVLSRDGVIEDSARKFPTFFTLLRRLLSKSRKIDYKVDSCFVSVDWVAGMFVVFRAVAYERIGGFDDGRFFMYFEDVDLCHRLRHGGWDIVLNGDVSVVHLAQRASKNNLKHMRWHLISAFRYLSGL